MTASEWRLSYVLPNFTLVRQQRPGQPYAPLGLEARGIALVDPDDPRLLKIRQDSTAADTLLGAFIDEHGAKYPPAALIARRNAPIRNHGWQSGELTYRNAIAIAVLLRTAATRIARRMSLGPLYSDAFFVYPTTVGHDGVSLRTIAPGFGSSNPRPRTLCAMPLPYIGRAFRPLLVDRYLQRALTAEWERRFVGPRPTDDPFARVLFRSLDVAFQAAASPARNGGSIHDYGVGLALWVSAIEILVWPSAQRSGQKVDRGQSLSFLDDYGRWAAPRLSRRSNIVQFGKKTRKRVRWIEWACDRLYKARNCFLHGEPVSRGLLYPIRTSPRASLVDFAPVVYRTALCTYLQPRYPSARVRADAGRTLDLTMAEEVADTGTYERALLDLLTPET